MGTRHYHRQALRWQSSIADMKAEGTIVKAGCACGHWEVVDLDEMAAILGGEDYTLWDLRPQCSVCDRTVTILASPGAGTPFRPMHSPAPWCDMDKLPFEQRLPGWLGWGGPVPLGPRS